MTRRDYASSRCGSQTGKEYALRSLWLDEALADAADDLPALVCAEQDIDAHYRADGWLWSATAEPWIGAWRSTIARLETLGERPFRDVDAAEAVARTGSPSQLAAAFEPTAAIVQPALLARGLL